MILLNHSLYHKQENLELHLGDSFKLLQTIPDESVDMVFADPPYHLSNGGITVKSGKMESVNKADWDASHGVDDDFDFHNRWIAEIKRILKPHGTLWVSGTYHSIYHCGHAIQANNYKILNEIVWFKPNGAPNISRRYFAASHETLIWAAKDENSKHTFNYNEMRDREWVEDPMKKEGKQMRSVWSIPAPGKNEKMHGKHPTQKPRKLLRRIILASTKPKDIVLDPFTGSSTTGIEALELDRQYYGIDNDSNYLDLSVNRLKDMK